MPFICPKDISRILCHYLFDFLYPSSVLFLLLELLSFSSPPLTILVRLALYLTYFLMDGGWLPLSHEQLGGNQWKFNRGWTEHCSSSTKSSTKCSPPTVDYNHSLLAHSLSKRNTISFSSRVHVIVSWVKEVSHTVSEDYRETQKPLNILSKCFVVLPPYTTHSGF